MAFRRQFFEVVECSVVHFCSSMSFSPTQIALACLYTSGSWIVARWTGQTACYCDCSQPADVNLLAVLQEQLNRCGPGELNHPCPSYLEIIGWQRLSDSLFVGSICLALGFLFGRLHVIRGGAAEQLIARADEAPDERGIEAPVWAPGRGLLLRRIR